jgi:hypothetical protein
VTKILFLAANPAGTSPLQLDEESRRVDQALRGTDLGQSFDLRQHWAVRYGDLQELLLRYRPEIVHFSGHGSPASELMLQDELGRQHPVSAEALARLFELLHDNVRCVVLNACYSAVQAQGIASQIDAVVGMGRAISDEAALEFAAAFYQALGYGRSVATAFGLACNRIDLANLPEAETPKLLAPRVDAGEIVFAVRETGAESAGAATLARLPAIDTGGGAYFAGPVEVSGGVLVGRGQHVAGDFVQVDQRRASVSIEAVFRPIRQAVATAALRPDQQTEALQALRDLEAEAGKGEGADDGRLARLVDGLVDLVPGAVSAVVSAFASPVLGGIAGPVTSFILDKLRERGR